MMNEFITINEIADAIEYNEDPCDRCIRAPFCNDYPERMDECEVRDGN